MENLGMRRALAMCVAFVMVLSLPRSLDAIVMFEPTDHVPISRLIHNTTQYVKAHPKDSGGYYMLGRLHSLAFAGNTRTIEIWKLATGSAYGLPVFPFLEPVPRPERTNTGTTLPETARWHLVESLHNYRRATELQPKQPMAFLGLGWMLEQGALFPDEINAPFKKPPQRAAAQEWRAQALAIYNYAAAHSAELYDANPQPETPEGLVIEANRAILRLLNGPDLSADQTADRDRARKVVESYEQRVRASTPAANQNSPQVFKSPQVISPIIFPLRGVGTLESLLAPGRIVSFDLAGDGAPKKWPWVNSDAGFLVWDPENQQHIDSGRQLFGSVTWWMFWRDGYAALAALDDDGNGWLEGDELAGIAIWRDINENGVCDPGEVIPLRNAGILRIAVRASGRTSKMPFNVQGIQFNDGTFKPTYDWMPESIQ
jgi:hypothetical protein